MMVSDFAYGKNKITNKTRNKYTQIIKSNETLQKILKNIKYGSE